MLRNERFSGRGHARHLCRDCARLGPAELEVRQAEIDLYRAWSCGRRGRLAATMDRLRVHPNPKVRVTVQEFEERVERERQGEERLFQEDEIALEVMEVFAAVSGFDIDFDPGEAPAFDPGEAPDFGDDTFLDDDIPF